MSQSGRVWDSGMQNERTALAWSRVNLAIAVVGGLVARVFWLRFPPLAIAWLVVVAVLCETLRRVSRHRYLRTNKALNDGLPVRDDAGTLLILAAVCTLGVSALVACLM